MNRRLLQVINGLLAVATVLLAAGAIAFGTAHPFYADADLPPLPVLDSNLRFFGGMGIGIGVVLLLITPHIERHTAVFRAAWLCAWLGGLGRAISLVVVGWPPIGMVVFTAIELLGAPLLVGWQAWVARQSGRSHVPTADQ